MPPAVEQDWLHSSSGFSAPIDNFPHYLPCSSHCPVCATLSVTVRWKHSMAVCADNTGSWQPQSWLFGAWCHFARETYSTLPGNSSDKNIHWQTVSVKIKIKMSGPLQVVCNLLMSFHNLYFPLNCPGSRSAFCMLLLVLTWGSRLENSGMLCRNKSAANANQ